MAVPNEAALQAIKELTTNVLALSLAVFSLVGGFLTSAKKELLAKKVLVLSLSAFGVSILLGGAVLMVLVGEVVGQTFDPTGGLLRLLSASQILVAGFGCVLFFIYLSKNLWE